MRSHVQERRDERCLDRDRRANCAASVAAIEI
jgi:hypothetical protein